MLHPILHLKEKNEREKKKKLHAEKPRALTDSKSALNLEQCEYTTGTKVTTNTTAIYEQSPA